jgi:hypothetical protein
MLLLVACGKSASTATTSGADAEAVAQRRAEICVSAAMATISGEPRDNASVLSRVRQADLSNCPGDFSADFVGLRQAFENAVNFDDELSRHQQAAGDAIGESMVVGFAEWLLNTNSGITPFRDWVSRDSELSARANDVAANLRSQYQELERSAARYGNERSGSTVLLVQGEDPQGAPIYAFVLMTSDKVAEFMSAQRGGRTVYPDQYGRVVLSGSGTPSDQDYEQMQREYGFDRYGQSSVH